MVVSLAWLVSAKVFVGVGRSPKCRISSGLADPARVPGSQVPKTMMLIRTGMSASHACDWSCVVWFQLTDDTDMPSGEKATK
jgi:hypothetical protein